jgi:hypothetical protein
MTQKDTIKYPSYIELICGCKCKKLITRRRRGLVAYKINKQGKGEFCPLAGDILNMDKGAFDLEYESGNIQRDTIPYLKSLKKKKKK